ncbi:MAG: tryptophan--tRNA ligase [Rhodoferax sp.]|jgi:tryptophanyl-tRNA synthetase|uniref:tryptophan--tRNA ligase n=1 Tax=Rhodoferax sp. TaxID=50421 RepID=UPI001B768341|nr:tryptophan--tRNA ligase [Rhodoferax sp.]MBP8286512.1 tryptophan--tRNA ligase [Rhodoferax sp.]MBP9736060.1 tryptophan--tRNA ligase [Rhodoferax sp.]
MSIERYLTGITTSGTPHLGNYVGAIRPAVRASLRDGVESFYFLADYHALIKVDEPQRIQQSTLEIAASWLACGLDPQRVVFYRQSDIAEIPELTWFLTCVLGKGVLNRAHAYKAAVDKNLAAGLDQDAEVSAGLYMYPVLMGADILMFKAHKVPVGRDQVQHIEMARDMANSFNYRYGEHFVPPDAAIEDNVATLPGLDGRKMSKSYDNTIPLFAPRAELKKLIAGIVTNSRQPGEPKDTDGSALFQIYQAFADDAETQALRHAFAQGVGWGEAKQIVFERLDQEIAPMRERYQALISDPARIEAILQTGASKARAIATPFMQQLRHAVGLRNLAACGTSSQPGNTKIALPTFKQYREPDGLFYFKLVSADGQLLLQSGAMNSPKLAGQTIAELQTRGRAALDENRGLFVPGAASDDEIGQALEALIAAKAK